MASGFKVASGYVELHLDKDQLRSEIAGLPADLNNDVDRSGRDVGRRLGRGIGDGADGAGVGNRVTNDLDRTLQPRSQRSGRDAGDKLSQGFQLAMVRNSPLIAAAIAGALTAGTPVAIASVTTLFTAIAAAAVSGNKQVATQFKNLTDSATGMIKQAATVAIPYFLQSIQRLSAGVKGLEPQFRSAFSALGPSIDALTTGVLKFVQNAMPGMVAAVRGAQPIMAGLATLLGDIGTGLSQFFSILSKSSSAGGQVFASLGSIIQSLLPILGHLIAAGAQVASAVLPPIAAAFGAVASVLDRLSPILPAVLAGFLAFTAVRAASAALGGFQQSLAMASYSAGPLASTAGRLSTLMGGLRSALPLVGLAVVGLGLAFQAGQSDINNWAKALNLGGDAAAKAASEMQHIHDVTQPGLGGLHSWADVWDRIKALTLGTSDAQSKAAQTAREQLAAMSPLERAGQAVTKAQNDYLRALEKYGPASGQAAGAAVAFRDASQKQKDVQDQLNIAIHGVTQAMIDQADEALAAIDSNFALQHAQNQQRDAEIALADAIKQHGSASTEAHDAEQSYVESIYNTAKAAAQLKADQSGLTQGSLEYKNVLDSQLLASLKAVESTLTGPEKAAIDGFIQQLEAAGVKTDTTSAKVDNLGQKKPTPQVRLDDKQFNAIYSYVNGAITTLHGRRPTPTAFMNTQPFGGAAASMNAMLAYLAGRHITPSASLIAYTLAAENALNYAARNRTSYVTQYYVTGGVGSQRAAATGGKVGDVVGLAGKRFDFGGKIRGPGGPTDDLVQAVTRSGTPLRVSNDEWVIKGSSSAKYGDYKMAAINAGVAQVTVPQRALAGGGPVGTSSSPSSSERPIIINLSMPMMVGAPDRAALRKAAVMLRDEIRKVERELR